MRCWRVVESKQARAQRLAADAGEKFRGEVVAAFGRQVEVQVEGGTRIACGARGRKMEAVCGDQVTGHIVARGQGIIEALDERRTVLFRRDAMREKVIAANVSQLAYVVAGDPPFSDDLLSRCLVAAEAAGIDSLIALNKCDLGGPTRTARTLLEPFAAIGCKVVEVVATPLNDRDDRHEDGVDALRRCLAGHITLLIGQSGMGKSTLINALVPDAQAVTGEISRALSAGRHTTTSSRLYRLERDTALNDSPGLQAFGLAHVPVDRLAYAFPEFRTGLGHCRFDDCTHQREPGCAILALVTAGRIDPRRMQAYTRIVDENRHAAQRFR
ncbi:MAG: ribosome small subunit-dependent GTPase A [Proteobacteria bacterium]|nr:ribosome small subunit-dependent GTPase A [Burkholderiales bacterium]